MLSFLRKGLSSWLLLGLLGLVLAAFVITGVRDPFSGTSGGGGAKVASVAGKSVALSTLDEELQRKVRELQRRQPDLTLEQVVRGGGVQGVLDGLVGRLSLEYVMNKFGITGGTNAVADLIAKEPAFQLGGVFNPKLYRDMLRNQRLSQSAYEQQLTADVGRGQLLGAISREWSLPDSLILSYANLLEERRTIGVAVIPASAVGVAPEPDPVVLKAFYEKNKQSYSAPELRTFRYIVLSPQNIKTFTTPTEAEVDAYLKNNPKLLGTPEKRDLQLLSLESKAAAEAFIEKLKAGDSFEHAAGTAIKGLTAADLVRLDVAADDLKTDIGEENANQVFALGLDAVSPPLETPLGWQVFRVTKIKPAQGGSLDKEARLKAVEALTNERAINTLYDLTKKIDDASGKRKSFDDLAKIAGLSPIQLGPVSSQGTDINDQTVPAAKALGQTLQLAFNHRPGDELLLEQVGDNTYALVEVLSINPAAPRPLDQIKPLVVLQWQRDYLNAKAKVKADEIAAAVRMRKPLSVAAAGFPQQPSITVRRADLSRAGPGVPPALMKVFTLKQGEVAVAPAPDRNGYWVANLILITPGQASKDGEVYKGLKNSIERYGSTEPQAQFVTAARQLAGVTVDQAAVGQLTHRLLGKE